MRLFSAAVIAAIMVLAPNKAGAKKIDLATMICQEFVDSSDTQQEIIVAWLAGFANGASEPKIVDDEAVMDDADDFNEFCKKNPETSLLQAEMQLFQ